MDGYIHGVRIRWNFKTRDEAIAEKGVLDVKAVQADSGLRVMTTFLSDDQLREAESEIPIGFAFGGG